MKTQIAPDNAALRKYLLVGIAGLFVAVYYDVFSCEKIFTHDSISWYGIFHYYVENLAGGRFPYWDPFLNAGTYSYPTLQLNGLLDPIVLIFAALRRLFDAHLLTLYIYFRMLRLFIYVTGAYHFFGHVSGSRTGALLAAGILLFATPLGYFLQAGALDNMYLMPFALLFMLQVLEVRGGTRRYLALVSLALVIGVSMNIYIPALFAFNLSVFFIMTLVLRIVPRGVAGGLWNRRFVVVALMTLVLAGMMTAPSIITFSRDLSAGGELFPMQRILEKNDRLFKKMDASELNSGNLSDRFTKNQGIFFSTGNILDLLYPDINKSFRYWAINDFESYVHLYIGIIPFILCLIGMLYHKSRYRYLILLMAAISFINGFSVQGVHDRPYNFLQEMFNAVFPPLKMFQVRECFGFFFMLYLCAFLSMGIGLVLENGSLLTEKFRKILLICLALITIKLVVSWSYGGMVIYNSAYDLAALLQIPLFTASVFLMGRRPHMRRVLLAVLCVVAFSDLSYYNRVYSQDILQDSGSFYRSVGSDGKSVSASADEGFQFFRDPVVFLGARHSIAFEESITRRKGALSVGFNHGIFATKRYYDFLTHVPLRNQFVLNGVVYPVVNFVAADKAVQVDDRKTLLAYLSQASPDEIADRLFIEHPAAPSPPPVSMAPLDSYEDVTSLRLDNIMNFQREFVSANGDMMNYLRSNLDGYLHNQMYFIDVRGFTINDVTIAVRNDFEGYLHYNDGWSRYWEAYDGDKKIPVYIANYNSKAVFLPKGEHLVRFVFNPVHYKIALVLYYAGLLVTAGAMLFFYLRSRSEAVVNSG